MKKPSRPLSLRETYAETDRAMEFYAGMFDKSVVKVTPEMKPKRERKASVPSDDTEAPLMTQTAELLKTHPGILFAVRQNNGAMYYEKGRDQVPFWFYRWGRRNGVKMRITDWWGLFLNGRMWVIECKKPSWTHPMDDREIEQQNFIEVVKSSGGAGGFATHINHVWSILDS